MILIAGTGYIGSALAEALSASGHSIAALNRTTPSELPLPYPQFSCDISDKDSVRKIRSLLTANPTVVVNCASSGRGGPDAYRKVYLQGSANLLDTFPSSRLIFTSSTSVYPQTDGTWVDENTPGTPSRETGQTLLDTERLVTSSGGTVARLAGIYGPGRSVVLQRYLEARSTIDHTQATPDGRYINQAHQTDIVSALALLATLPASASEIYNIADDHPLTQLQLYTGLSKFFDLPLPPLAPPDLTRKRGWTHKRISNAKLRSLGWAPSFPSYMDALTGDPLLVPSIKQLISAD